MGTQATVGYGTISIDPIQEDWVRICVHGMREAFSALRFRETPFHSKASGALSDTVDGRPRGRGRLGPAARVRPSQDHLSRPADLSEERRGRIPT